MLFAALPGDLGSLEPQQELWRPLGHDLFRGSPLTGKMLNWSLRYDSLTNSPSNCPTQSEKSKHNNLNPQPPLLLA